MPDDVPLTPTAMAASLYAKHSQEILAFFRCSRSMSAEDAGDLLQQTFEELLKTLERQPDQEIDNPRAYLFTIARRQFSAVLKRRATRPKLVGEDAAHDPASEVESDDLEFLSSMRADQRLLLRALRRLTDDDDAKADTARDGAPVEEAEGSAQQLILYLRHWAGLTLAEVADILDTSRGTVSGRLRRALVLLRRRVDALESDSDARHTSTTVLERWQEALEEEAKRLVPDEEEAK